MAGLGIDFADIKYAANFLGANWAESVRETIINTTEINRDHSIRDIGSVPDFPSLLELVRCADLAYAQNCASALAEMQRGGVMWGWILLKTANDDGITNGYAGALFYHPTYRQIIIAHRGTVAKSPNSGLQMGITDGLGILKKHYVPQVYSAVTLTLALLNVLNGILRADGRAVHFDVFITGHSLGGWLSQITCFAAKYLYLHLNAANAEHTIKILGNVNAGHHCHTVAFESPGCSEMLLRYQDSCQKLRNGARLDAPYNPHKLKFSIEDLDITTFLTDSSVINAPNVFIGALYRLPKAERPPRIYSLWNIKRLFTDLIEGHSVAYVTKCVLRAGSQYQGIEPIIDWPVINFSMRRLRSFSSPIKYAGSLRTDDNVDFNCSRFKSILTHREQQFLIKYRHIRGTNLFREEFADLDVSITSRLNDCQIDFCYLHLSSPNERITRVVMFIRLLLQLKFRLFERCEKLIRPREMKMAFYKSQSQRYIDDCLTPNLLVFSANVDISSRQVVHLKISEPLVQIMEIHQTLARTQSIPFYVFNVNYLSMATSVIKLADLFKLFDSLERPDSFELAGRKHLFLIECTARDEVDRISLERVLHEMNEMLRNLPPVQVILVSDKLDTELHGIVEHYLRDRNIQTPPAESLDDNLWQKLDATFKEQLVNFPINFQDHGEVTLRDVLGIDVGSTYSDVFGKIDFQTILRLKNEKSRLLIGMSKRESINFDACCDTLDHEIRKTNLAALTENGRNTPMVRNARYYQNTRNARVAPNVRHARNVRNGRYSQNSRNARIARHARNARNDRRAQKARNAQNNKLFLIVGKSTALLDSLVDSDDIIKLTQAIACKRIQFIDDCEDPRDEFKKICHDRPDRTVYFFNRIDRESIHCEEIYCPSFYLLRQFEFKQEVVLTRSLIQLQLTWAATFVLVFGSTLDAFLQLFDETDRAELSMHHTAGNILFRHDLDADVLLEQEGEAEIPVVHYIKIEGGTKFVWHRSTGGSLNLIRSSINKKATQTVCRSQNVLTRQSHDGQASSLPNLKTMIVVDEPGMGKSTSLNSLCSELKSVWVLRVNLKNSDHAISELSGTIGTEQAVKFFAKIDKKGLGTTLAEQLLTGAIEGTSARRVYCLFDAFDEIRPSSSARAPNLIEERDALRDSLNENKEKIVELLKYLHSKPNVYLWITTRESGKLMLEDNLSVLAVKFKRLEREQQIKFLTTLQKIRTNMECLSSSSTQTQFQSHRVSAEGVLLRAESVLGDISNFIGIPLQLKLLRSIQNKMVQGFGAGDIYELFCSWKFTIFMREKARMTPEAELALEPLCVETLRKYYSYYAFQQMFPSYREKFFDIDSIDKSLLSDLCRIGIVQPTAGVEDCVFCHKTFAEFWIAHVIYLFLTITPVYRYPGLDEFEEFFVTEVLLNRDNNVIRLFLNYKLAEKMIEPSAYGAKRIADLWKNKGSYFYNSIGESPFHLMAAEKLNTLAKFFYDIKFDNPMKMFCHEDDNNRTSKAVAVLKNNQEFVKMYDDAEKLLDPLFEAPPPTDHRNDRLKPLFRGFRWSACVDVTLLSVFLIYFVGLVTYTVRYINNEKSVASK